MNPTDPVRLAPIIQATLSAADSVRGRTSPNPPVAAAAVTESGMLLEISAHLGAGLPHAEQALAHDLETKGLLNQVHTLIVTLEPCNHQGRTPPCAPIVLEVLKPKQIILGARDPNPSVKGGGAELIEKSGVPVHWMQGAHAAQAEALIAPFRKWCAKKLPYITIKSAHLPNGSMIPPKGTKTFSSAESLKLAHKLRKRADAILTSATTICQDDPLFTVRHIADHPNSHRILAIIERNQKVPRAYLALAERRGLRPMIFDSPENAVQKLSELGVHEILVESGPRLRQYMLDRKLWDEQCVIQTNAQRNEPDQVVTLIKPASEDT